VLLNRKRHAILFLVRVVFAIILSLLGLAIAQCSYVQPAMVQPQVRVAFDLSASSGNEAATTVNLVVKLNAPSNQTVTVDYIVASDSTASNTELGSGKDYILTPATLTFEPGTAAKTVSISILDDSINEADETIQVKLSNPNNATLGANSSYTHTIIDNDRKSMINVKDFGAVGDGITDDTIAIQKAINIAYDRGGGVILFPPSVYIVTSVNIRENITYQGYGATIKRPAMQDKWTRTFTTEKSLYAGNLDSKPLIVKGLTFDGNSQNQVSYKGYELEQAHLIFLIGDRNYPGKLRAVVEDCNFQNGVADGISVYTNVSIKVHNCKATDVFRGGFVLTGGYSSAEVSNLTTSGKIDPTGIDVEVDGAGYGGTYKVDLKFEAINLIDGDFDIGVHDGSIVIGNNIYADAPFYLYGENSTMRFTNSTFKVGAATGLTNRIVYPHDITFENCDIIVTRKEDPPDSFTFFGLDIWWQLPTRPEQRRNQSLVFNNCRFKVDTNITSSDLTYAIYLRPDPPENNNILKINGGYMSPEFKAGIFQ
jgi:Calx-beta domain/Pectate lyase superfamily protein